MVQEIALVASGLNFARQTLWPLVSPIFEELFTDRLEEAINTGTDKLLDAAGSRLSEKWRSRIVRATEQYTKQYIKRHGILKVLGMREPVNLDEVYTNVRLLNESTIRDFISTDALETAFRESSQRRLQGKNCETRVGVEVTSEQQFLMVLGQPGAGKSTFLRKLGLEALKGKAGDYQHQCIPVLLELKRFDSTETSIQDRIVAEFAICGFPKPEEFTAKALEKGQLLVLFDGLDEVPSQQVNGVIDQIQDFVDRYDDNRFIASCRTAAYRSGFRRFKDVVMADFDDEQIQQYIENWFSSETDQEAETAKHCWELLQREDQQGAKELAQTPLLLTFLCLVYDRSQSFSSNRSTLYRRALRILLEEWAAEKRINRETIYQGLHTDLEEQLLAEIAYQNFVEDRLFFKQEQLIEQISNFLADTLDAPKALNSTAILDAIAVQQGIFVERAYDTYSFSHLTLQEYLTAKFIVSNGLVDEVVERHLLDKEWKEVFLLIASSIEGRSVNQFLLKLTEQIEKLLEQPVCREKLVPILLWAETETKDAGGNLSLLARRSVANAFAYANTYANTNVYAYANKKNNTYIYAYAKTNAIAIAYAYTKAFIIAHAKTDAYTYTSPGAFAYAYANNNAFTYTFAFANKNTKDAIDHLISSYQEISTKDPIFNEFYFSFFIKELQEIKEQAPGNKADRETEKIFADRLKQIIFEAHHFPPELADLSREEIKVIDNYYYATYLLIQCKAAAVRVSPDTWAAIEERMLRVPEHLREGEMSNE